MDFTTDFLATILRIGTPLLLAAMGELILERSGILNIGIEGVMLGGALAGFLAAWSSGSPLLGAAGAMLAGALLALLLGFMVLRMRGNQIVVGMALNLAAFGLCGTIYRGLLHAQEQAGRSVTLEAPVFPRLWPEYASVPIIGPILLDQTLLTWSAYALVVLIWYYLERSERGLELRAVGEHPGAAEASGINVTFCRYKACLAAGALGGLAGGFLTLSQAASFSPRCTNGRGFVALAAVVLGRYNPWGTAAACLFFSAAFAARDRLQARGWAVETELLDMLPYVLPLLALLFAFQRRTGAPAALGKPYG